MSTGTGQTVTAPSLFRSAATPVVNAPIVRWADERASAVQDCIAVEEPCEIHLGGDPVAVVMRTPGQDAELAAGFLITEGLLGADSIGDILVEPEQSNVIDVELRTGAVPRAGWQRRFYASSSCGICGTSVIQALRRDVSAIVDSAVIAPALLMSLVDGLRDGQNAFQATGGLHAAALCSVSGELIAVREDIGRHNAVDKIIGYAALQGLYPLTAHVLILSGRSSFEIVQKALMARIPIVAGISAASSLAIRLATHTNMTLVGFARAGRMNVYCGMQRLTGQPAPSATQPGGEAGGQ